MGRGRAPCCDKSKVRSGPWSREEDLRLITFVGKHGHPNWRAIPKQAGLLRCGKSCRLRWINYLRPDVKRGNFTPEEEETIINLHNSIGNKWSKIAASLPGRTDNEIKNVWNTYLKKKAANNCKTSTPEDCPKSTLESNDSDELNSQLLQHLAPQSALLDEEMISGNQDMEILPSTDDHLVVHEFEEVVKTQSNNDAEKPMFAETTSISTHPNNYAQPNQKVLSDDFPSHPSTVLSSNISNNSSLDNRSSEGELGLFNWVDAILDYESAIKIPSGVDADFWGLVDSLDPVQSNKPEEEQNTPGEHSTNIPTSFGSEVVEFSQWMSYLENELGLRSDGEHDQSLSKDLQPEISRDFDNCFYHYFPDQLWPPSSPLYFSI